jgi:hypothetical protein
MAPAAGSGATTARTVVGWGGVVFVTRLKTRMGVRPKRRGHHGERNHAGARWGEGGEESPMVIAVGGVGGGAAMAAAVAGGGVEGATEGRGSLVGKGGKGGEGAT